MDAAEKALELSSQYGVVAVTFFLMAFFLAGLIIYVLKQNERRENKYFDLVEDKLKAIEHQTNERYLINQKAMSDLAEAARRQREEHDTILSNQKMCVEQHQKISNLLDSLLTKLTLKG